MLLVKDLDDKSVEQQKEVIDSKEHETTLNDYDGLANEEEDRVLNQPSEPSRRVKKTTEQT